jgi:hypothetical protein
MFLLVAIVTSLVAQSLGLLIGAAVNVEVRRAAHEAKWGHGVAGAHHRVTTMPRNQRGAIFEYIR